VIVSTRLGRIEGSEQRGVWAFRGIPYAAPPVGELRFRAPEPPAPWSSLRDGRQPGATAPQLPSMMRDLLPQSEDCLQLNVWTPRAPGAPGKGALPVMVFIHGGGFASGASTHPMYSGHVLAQRGQVVVVSFNYRLGALGFADMAALGDGALAADANCGLLDQLAALRFVREHIADFGGDPDCVTVFAQSAGAMSLADLLGSEAAAGLFARAICQSGAAHHVTTRTHSAPIAERLLDALKLGPRDLGQLRALPVEAIVRAQAACLRHTVEVGAEGRPLRSASMTLLPVVDGALLPERPIAAAAAGKGGQLPLLIGTNRDEWHFWAYIADPYKRDLDHEGLLRELERRAPGRALALAETYQRALARPGAAVEPFEIWSAVETDCVFGMPARRLAEARASGPAPTFMYEFGWNGPLFDGRLGACHSMELPFVLGLTDEGFGQVFAGGGPEAEALARRTMDAWVAFARTGDPSTEALGTWPAYDLQRRPVMALNAECALLEDPGAERAQFWNELI
jgi:para-nitrobenzyl esterase